MRISVKLLLTLVFAAVIPLAVSSAVGVSLARESLEKEVFQQLQLSAHHLAELGETYILSAVSDLERDARVEFSSLSAHEQEAAIRLLFGADPRRAAMTLIDADSLELATRIVYRAAVEQSEFPEHPVFSDSDKMRFVENIPLDAALKGELGVSKPYHSLSQSRSVVAIAAPLGLPGKKSKYILAAEISLARLAKRFARSEATGTKASFLDSTGRSLLAKSSSQKPEVSPLVVDILSERRDDPLGVLEIPEQDLLAAWAWAPSLTGKKGHWFVLVERGRTEALEPIARLKARTIFWVCIALLLSVISAVLLARGIAQPLEVLTRVVDRFGAGEFQVRSEARGRDEISRLAARFNTMADGINARDDELRAFNEKLQDRVDERTRELRDAQESLLQSQKLAAVGELGAGVAHEINNPLASVLGAAQLALLRCEDDSRFRPQLEDIEKEALRIRDIVDSLLRLSQDSGDQGMDRIDLASCVDSALSLYTRAIIRQRIQVKKEYDTHLPMVRGRSADLQQAFMHIFANAKESMPDGGILTVRAESVAGKLVRISISDTGGGISEADHGKIFEPFYTTRANDGHKGIGLSMVHRIIEDHQARISVDSDLQTGTTVRISFPATRERAHLV